VRRKGKPHGDNEISHKKEAADPRMQVCRLFMLLIAAALEALAQANADKMTAVFNRVFSRCGVSEC